MKSEIQHYLLSLPEYKQVLASELREVMLSVKGIDEAIKWNNLTFMYGKHNFAFIYTFKQTDYMNLGFFDAIHLNDPKKLLEGTGKTMRHIKVYTSKDIPVTQIRKWVKESVQLFGK